MLSGRFTTTSDYWNVIYGHNINDSKQDEEGIRILKNLAQNMAWTMELVQNGKKTNIKEPTEIKSAITSMIR